MKVLILIPAYNEEELIGTLLDRLLGMGFGKEDILVVDDGSIDRTEEVVKKRGVTLIRFDTNRGKGKALQRGFEYALKKGYDGVITMDADLQHDPEFIPLILKEAGKGFDIVIGSRFENLKGMPPDRYLSNRLTTLFLSLLARRKLKDTQSGYRFLSRKVLEHVDFISERFEAESELIVKAAVRGFRVGYVPITTLYMGEKSSINRLIDTLRFIRMYVRLLWHLF